MLLMCQTLCKSHLRTTMLSEVSITPKCIHSKVQIMRTLLQP